MRYLNYDSLDIVRFAGLGERILVMDPGVFGHQAREDSWGGFAGLTYLAHAFFRPGGSTGMHRHQAVNIVSVITRGRILHQGTLGDGDIISAGEVLVQRSGNGGFQHNEINPDDDVYGMVQLWLTPDSSEHHAASHDKITLQPGLTTVYRSDNTCIDIVRLNPDQSWHFPRDSYLYLYQGRASAEHQSQQTAIERGTLIHGQDIILIGRQDETAIIAVYRADDDSCCSATAGLVNGII
jgi:redox-sensitive bicupin YhaK (pirin superfamily)